MRRSQPDFSCTTRNVKAGRVSSSGSGVAVAARMVHAALGSDTGGSIRLPASLCGVTGIKGTQTRVSRAGVMPLSFSMDNVGPLTRTARDAARLMTITAGHDPRDPTSAREAEFEEIATQAHSLHQRLQAIGKKLQKVGGG